jgi:hypothetical protein
MPHVVRSTDASPFPQMNARIALAGALMTTVALAITACGGGGDAQIPPGPSLGDTVDTVTAVMPPACAVGTLPFSGTPALSGAVLSPTQASFEELFLAANGGAVVPASWYQMRGGAWALAELELPTISVSPSPLNAQFPIGSTYRVAKPLLPVTLTSFRDDADPTRGTTFLYGGMISFAADASPPRFSYDGADVLTCIPATRGMGGSTLRTTAMVKVPLSGTFASAPAELRDLFANDPRFGSTLTFAPGSAYYRQTRVRVGDAVELLDADSNSATDPSSATPVAADTTIEAYFSGHSLELSTGQVRTVNGARCWIGPVDTSPGASPSSHVAYCEVAGNVYAARYQPDGADAGSTVPTGTAMAHSPYSIRLNQAAAESIATMLVSTQASLAPGGTVTLAGGQWTDVPVGAVITDTAGNTINVAGHDSAISVSAGSVVTVPSSVAPNAWDSVVIAR